MKKLTNLDKEALKAAFDVCFTMKEHCDNVIASGEIHKSDVDMSKNCKKYINWYIKINKS